MVFFNPIFNNSAIRPYRWALQHVDSGDIIDGTWLADDKFVHWTTKPIAVQRDVFTDVSPYTIGNFTPMRKRLISFLTTHHKDMYEDGKYTEVYNDPVNYIFDEDTTYTGAYLTAEARIGNYRSGVRRHITHLGGTLSEDELDMLEDNQNPPVALTSFPLFPPLPTTDFGLPFRTKLVTSDVGYIDYIKAAHPDETTATDKYAYQAKQNTGYHQFIFDAGNINMKYETTTTAISVPKVQIEDIEIVLDAAINTATDTDTTTFLPANGTYVIYNVAAKTVFRMDAITGVSMEHYDGTGATLGVLQSFVNIEATGNITIEAGTTSINIVKDGVLTINNGAVSITMDGSTVDVT